MSKRGSGNVRDITSRLDMSTVVTAISESTWTLSRVSKLRSTESRNSADMMMPPIASAAMIQRAAPAISRNASERDLLAIRHPVAQPADGLDDIGAQLAPQPADKDFDGVGIEVEILIVEMFRQFRA